MLFFKNYKYLFTFLLTWYIGYISFAQTDSTYIKTYTQKNMFVGFVGTNSIQINDGNKDYIPNYPLIAGIGFSIKNTIFSGSLGYGFFPLKNEEEYGKTKSIDFRIHNYGKQFILDLFFINYKGFYSQDEEKEILTGVYPDMTIQQIGAEGTYVFNGKQFSSRAAFQQSEIQLKSAGSLLLGGGAYYYKVNGFQNDFTENDIKKKNIQLGINTGYAYSWVINRYWLLSGMATVGANVGNEPEKLKDWKLEFYPAVFARFAGSYHKNDWGVVLSVLLNNKSIHLLNGKEELNLTTLGLQLSFVKHLDNIF